MKTLRKRKEKKLVKGFGILKVKELLKIRGGDEGVPTDRDKEIN